MDRGDRREDIFLDDVDRQELLKTLAEACQKTGWQVHAYCLMRNHFHLVLETPNANLVAGMRWFLSAYTIRLNHRQKLFGHVFSGRYKALIVEGSGNGYLKTACDYVHLNPIRAGLVGQEDRLLAYPWSSLVWYLAAVCWASMASSKTPLLAVRNLSATWKRAALRKTTKRPWNLFAVGGAWGARRSESRGSN